MPQTPLYDPPIQSKHSDIWHVIGIPSRGVALHQALREGLPHGVYTKLGEVIGLEKRALARALAIAPTTLQRRIKSGRFNLDESDRLYRLAQVFIFVLELFDGDEEAARTWIQRPLRGLGGLKPIDMIATWAETTAVLDLIGRLEHGVVA
jgi:putative toxin-antitoxin system antitoxin component (TIGR02293 family)